MPSGLFATTIPTPNGIPMSDGSGHVVPDWLLPNASGWLHNNGSGTLGYSTPTKADIGLGNVENTALSTWAGSTNMTTLGTISAGSWNATVIPDGKIALALTGKTYNGLTPTAASTGFTIAGGTASKTLTVIGDAIINQSVSTTSSPVFDTLNVAPVSGNASLTLTSPSGVSRFQIFAVNAPDRPETGWYSLGSSQSLMVLGDVGNIVYPDQLWLHGSIVSGGSIHTAAPSGGTGAWWRLGSVTSGYVQTEIDGTATKLATGDQAVATTSSPTFAVVKVAPSGTACDGIWSATGVLNFASIAAAASEDLTITVTGASVGDSVALGLPSTPAAGIIFQGFVSAANTVTVRATNITVSAVDPASVAYRVTVSSF